MNDMVESFSSPCLGVSSEAGGEFLLGAAVLRCGLRALRGES